MASISFSCGLFGEGGSCGSPGGGLHSNLVWGHGEPEHSELDRKFFLCLTVFPIFFTHFFKHDLLHHSYLTKLIGSLY